MKPSATVAAVQRLFQQKRRLLVVAGLLSAAATAYTPPPKAHVQAHTLTQQSLRQYQLGNHAAAVASLKSAQSLMLSTPHAFSSTEQQRLRTLLDHLQTSRPANAPIPPEQLQGYQNVLISLDPLQHSFKSKPQAAKESGYVRRSLQATWRAMPQPLFVEANVFQFGTQFRMGAKSPMDTLFSEKYRLHVQDGSEARPPNPALHFSEENSDRIDAWLNAPPEKRVFVIGARRDAFYVQKLRERYASSGIQFFFYQDCTPLCRESTVGAFFRTASAVIKVDSVAAQHSKFIPLEKRLTAEHNKTGRRLLLIDGDEAMRLLNSGGGGGTATLLACEIDALVSEDPLCK